MRGGVADFLKTENRKMLLNAHLVLALKFRVELL